MSHYTVRCFTKQEMEDRVRNDQVTCGGTSFVGTIEEDFKALLRCFGPPTFFDLDGYKTKAEWVLHITDVEGNLIVATIYDWKRDDEPWHCNHWHIGGFKYDAKVAVQGLLREWRERPQE